MVKEIGGIDVTFVPYRGLALALQNIAGGQAELGFADFGSLPLVRGDRLHALALASPKRAPQLPDVPTLRELGIALDVQPWLGLWRREACPRPSRSASSTPSPRRCVHPTCVPRWKPTARHASLPTRARRACASESSANSPNFARTSNRERSASIDR
ncbi:MAG: hypothetical protein IPI03_16330 [Rubrivivax sp.]|nr:hypothetical protein [Rubrivivax sp.]